MPEHESHSLQTRHWHHHYGILASFKKTFLLQWLSESYAVWQQVANGGSRKRIESYDRRMGQNKAKRVLRRQGYEMAIHYAPCPTSERMLWSSRQVHKVHPQESPWQSCSHPLRALHLPFWSCKSIEWTTHRQNTKRPRWWRLFMSKRHHTW